MRGRIRIAHPGSGSTSLQFTSLIFLQGKIDDEFLLEELSNCSWREPHIIVEERTYKDLVKKNINYNSFLENRPIAQVKISNITTI